MPLPVSDFLHILTMSGDVLFMLYQLVIHLLNQVCAFIAKLRQMDNGIFYEVEAVNLILDAHIERGSDGAFLQVTVNVGQLHRKQELGSIRVS